jgi:hypothetical protein
MTIIKQTDWLDPFGNPVQNIGENPARKYRELLMAEDPNDPDRAAPYVVKGPLPAGLTLYCRVPHGLSAEVAGGSRIPDVAIPILVDNPLTPTIGAPRIGLVWDPNQVFPNSSPNGLWADEDYIYLFVNSSTDMGLEDEMRFVVYIEYTHSIIGNEIVTGEYERIGFGGPI